MPQIHDFSSSGTFHFHLHPTVKMMLALENHLISTQLSSLDDAALVGLACNGREEAFDELVQRHSPRIHAVASRIVGREEAYDVIQDAFISAYRALNSFKNQSQFTTWLHRIALNCCYARIRKHPETNNDLEMPVEVSDSRAHPIDVVERRDLRFALERALSEIKSEFRETFVLVEFGDLDYAEAASVLGVELGTVKSRMSRARGALREKLEAWGYKP
jgi:RNA polymerase sigma-70 factor, ECF subfamily